ncbi:MAG: hypothetical protein HY342_01425 [Candidatus Lambdaproteobacteria bacterium]|nr:hypothetical protein [Candidatus Lambdaproteobacteria bacterium]
MRYANIGRQWLIAAATLFALGACQGGDGGSTPSTTTPLDPYSTTLISTSTIAATEGCPNGGVHVDWGIDSDRDGQLDEDEITGSGDVCNGETGSSITTLLRTSDASPDVCAAGGVVIEAGVDLPPFNNELDPGEENPSLAATICNGVAGSDGDPGNDGAAGSDGVSSLVDVQPADAETCPAGGVAISTGLDTTGDGSLGGEQGVSTNTICNGPVGNDGSSTRIVSAPFAPNSPDATASGCASASGLKLTIWLDLDDNGSSDDGIETVAYICDGQAGADVQAGLNALVVTAIEPPGDNCAFGGLEIRSGQDTNGLNGLDDEAGVTTNYVCHMGGMTLIQAPDWQTAWYARALTAVGLSTWDRIDGFDGFDWITAGATTYFYDAHVLINRTGATQAIDVGVEWSASSQTRGAAPWLPSAVLPLVKESGSSETTIGISPQGTMTLYDYPFNPLQPLLNVKDWSDGYEGSGSLNVLSFSLLPGVSVVVVPSPMDPGFFPGYALHVASSQGVDASGVGPGAPLELNGTAVVDTPQRFKLTGLTANGEYQAIVTSGNGDDAQALSHDGPFAQANCTLNASNSGTGDNVSACALYADTSGNAWLEVQGVTLADTGNYTLEVREALTADGNAESRVALTPGTGFDGSVGSSSTSYYAVESVQGGFPYRITLTNLYPTGDVTLYLDDGVYNNTCVGDTSTTVLACDLLTYGEQSSISVDAYDSGSGTGGAEYTITAGPGSEGSSGAPYALAFAEGHNGAVDTTSSYYQLSGIVPDSYQTLVWAVFLTNVAFAGSGEITITATTDGATVTSVCTVASTDTDDYCLITLPSDATTLDVTIDGSGSGTGAIYTIEVNYILF